MDFIQTAEKRFCKLQGMTHQPSFSQAEFADKKKITRREKFLTRMEALIPWTKLLAVLEPFYPQSLWLYGGGLSKAPSGFSEKSQDTFRIPTGKTKNAQNAKVQAK